MSKHPVNVEVRLQDNESFERLIRRFMKKVKKDRVIETFNEKQSYRKPSVIRREKKKRGIRVLRKLAAEQD